MVATSENPEQGLGPVSLFVTCRSGRRPFVLYLLPSCPWLCPKCVPGVQCKLVVGWLCPTPRPASVSSLSLCAETSQIVRMSVARMRSQHSSAVWPAINLALGRILEHNRATSLLWPTKTTTLSPASYSPLVVSRLLVDTLYLVE